MTEKELENDYGELNWLIESDENIIDASFALIDDGKTEMPGISILADCACEIVFSIEDLRRMAKELEDEYDLEDGEG